MKVTVINKRASSGLAVQCFDGVQVAPGQSHVMNGVDKATYLYQLGIQDHDVAVIGELDGSDRSPLICTMNTVANPGAGSDTSAGEGFAILTEAAAAANVAPPMYMGVFDDAACQIPSVHATLNTASAGTIVSGAGTNLLRVTPSATGTFACTVTNHTDEKVYLKAWPADSSYIIDSSSIMDVTMSPLFCIMNNVADPAGAANTSAGEGFALKTAAGAAANVQPSMYLRAYDDEECTVLAAHATLNTASAGTITAGAGTNSLTVTPSTTGTFACTVSDTTDETVYLKAAPVGSEAVDCTDVTSVTFSA